MSTCPFNLIDEKWIPCHMLDSSSTELNLPAVLSEAHKIKDLFDPSPLITASLHRLLLAILHRNFGPPSAAEWESLWRTGYFRKEPLLDYFNKWYDRFDLFSDEHPFYQTANFQQKHKKSAPPNDIQPEKARGNNPTLFDHTIDKNCRSLNAATAAKYLVSLHSFKLGGLSEPHQPNFTDAPSARNILFLMQGDNLFETLMLNLNQYDPSRNKPIPSSGSAKEDLPVWEQDSPPGSETPKGYLDYLTWQAVSIRLKTDPTTDDDGPPTVTGIDIAPGRKLNNNGSFFDPAVAYHKKDEKQGWKRLRFREGRALWRDSASLFISTRDEKQPPTTMVWLNTLVQRGIIEETRLYRVDAYGLCTEPGQHKINFWRHERMPLPMRYLADELLVADLQYSFLNRAEFTGRALGTVLQRFAKDILTPPGGRADPDSINRFVKHLDTDSFFWSQLELPFRRSLLALPEAREETIKNWIQTLRHTARNAFNKGTRDLDQSAKALKTLVRAKQLLEARLRELTNEQGG